MPTGKKPQGDAPASSAKSTGSIPQQLAFLLPDKDLDPVGNSRVFNWLSARGVWGVGGEYSKTNNQEVRSKDTPPHTPTPPTPSPSLAPSDIRKILQLLGINNVNMVIRKYPQVVIMQALQDYASSLADGFHPRNATAYFWSLLQ